LATAYITHPVFQAHDMGPEHPDSPRRLRSIEDRLQADGVMDLLRYHEAPLATREQLERAHTPAHIDDLAARAPDEGLLRLDPDTFMGPRTLEAAWRAAGAAVLGVDLVMCGDAVNAFCAVRPAGHHAERATAMGFCFFGNAAIAATHALSSWGVGRVAILDFDVHHGNGSEEILRAEPSALVCSVYQHPLYPFAGAPSIPGRIVNVPVPAGTTGPAWRAAVSEAWLPAIEDFRPEFFVLSAGFDGHVMDPMAQLMLTEADYAWITEQIIELAGRHAAGRIVSCLEGGYDLDALGRSAAVHVRRLAGL
jgi:acetoin utilization deacetylase AcuC-like enzyme